MTETPKTRRRERQGQVFVQVWFPEHLAKQADGQAKAELLTRSDVIRRAVQRYVTQEAGRDSK